MFLWYSWCVHTPEERGDSVRFREETPFEYETKML
jgi:hypothetical protein